MSSPSEALPPKVPRRIASVILNSLKGGVVPRIGLPYVTVGRDAEVRALLGDLDLVAAGGASFRFIVGRYGSGKSFLLQTIRNHAMGKGFVVCDADLSPERRLQGTHGQGLATYRELVSSLSTKTRPEGGALGLVLDRWAAAVEARAAEEGGLAPADPGFRAAAQARARAELQGLTDMVHGFDFARVLELYFDARAAGDEDAKGRAAKWLRGEYRTKAEARAETGVSAAIGDDDWYDYLKLFAAFLKGAGYEGLVVLIDELVNLYKIPNSVARQYNYEKVLTMYNDAMQGRARNIGIIMSGTPQSVEDRRRGLYSYEALRSRLAQGRFSREGMRDMLAPVIELEPLTYEELLVLAGKLADMHAGLHGYERALSDEDMAEFLRLEFGRVGADSHLTPREVIRDFIEMLDIMSQHPGVTVGELLGGSEGFEFARPAEPGAGEEAAGLRLDAPGAFERVDLAGRAEDGAGAPGPAAAPAAGARGAEGPAAGRTVPAERPASRADLEGFEL